VSRPATLVVVSARRDLTLPGVRVVDVDTYLAGAPEVCRAGDRVVNLCRSWRYLSKGYYVSLLAEARGQRPLPTVQTIEALQGSRGDLRPLRDAGLSIVDRREVAARARAGAAGGASHAVPLVRDRRGDGATLRAPRSGEVEEVLVALGRPAERRFARIAAQAYRAWPAPLLLVRLLREDRRWKVFDVAAARLHEIDAPARAHLADALRATAPGAAVARAPRRTLAVLYDEADPYKPSSPETLDRLERIAARRGLQVERIGPGEIERVGEHDALFIRTLTGVSLPAFRFAQRAESLGIPVVDDPTSIIRCSNKVYLFQLFARESIPTPRSITVGRDLKFADLAERLGVPYILKLPDGSFSAAVHRIDSEAHHRATARELHRRSPLLLAQEYLPTAFDWRVTVLDGKPLFVCRYHMAPGHWQIRRVTAQSVRYGRVEAVACDEAPADVVALACRAARLVGDGLYGVDLKSSARGPLVIEINDNPNIDVGYDDAADGDTIYEEIVAFFARRIARLQRDGEGEAERRAAKPAATPLRAAVGRVPTPLRRPYRAFEVCGMELEHVVVDRDLNALPAVEELLAALAGHPTSDVDLGLLGFSNEIFQHVIETKTPVPLRSFARTEEVLVEGVRRLSVVAAERLGARLLPGGMHPWLDPAQARLWTRSNRRVYDTYARLFDVHTHGWANVQASHVNLPVGRAPQTVAMMNAAALLAPYLPALAASSPMVSGELGPAVDNRVAYLVGHQARLPESTGALVPEYLDSLGQYRRAVLGPMYRALDRHPDAADLRHEFLNARAAVLKMSRASMEVRILDVQECVRMDVALACFVRRCLRALASDLQHGRLVLPDHRLLVADLHATTQRGSRARVHAPHLASDAPRDGAGRVAVRAVLEDLLRRAAQRVPADEAPYLELVAQIVAHGSLSERIAAVLAPIKGDDAFTEAARRIWIRLSECLVDNQPWEGRLP